MAAVLVAIAIPVFSSQLEKSREATDLANIRSAYAEVVTRYLADNDASNTIAVAQHQTIAEWQTSPNPVLTYQGGDGNQATYTISQPNANGGFTVGISVNTSGVTTPVVTIGGGTAASGASS